MVLGEAEASEDPPSRCLHLGQARGLDLERELGEEVCGFLGLGLERVGGDGVVRLGDAMGLLLGCVP